MQRLVCLGYVIISTVCKSFIPAMARLADKEANPLYPVPVLWNSEELESLYERVLVEN